MSENVESSIQIKKSDRPSDDLEDEITSLLIFDSEDDEGDTEYKRMLVGKSKDRIDELDTQMRYRIEQGDGQCTYIIGIEDNGTPFGLNEEQYLETRKTLEKICKRNDYSLRLLTETIVSTRKKEIFEEELKIYEFLIRENNTVDYEEVKIAMVGNVDSSKCECKNTKIRMYSGDVENIQDIIPGDLLMGDNSEPRKVLETTKGFSKMYKITPVNGEPLTVNKNHILCFKASNYNYVFWDKSRNRYQVRTFVLTNGKPKVCTKSFLIRPYDNKYYSSKEDAIFESKEDAKIASYNYLEIVLNNSKTIKLGDVVELTLEKFVNLTKLEKSALKLYRTGVDYKDQHIGIDPYMLGYWLGAGNSDDSIITIGNKEVIEYFEKNLPQYGLSIIWNEDYEYSIRPSQKQTPKKSNHFRNCLKKYNLYKNKHIPPCYKYNTRKIRLEILAGLIASDGILIREKEYAFYMSQKSINLVNDIVELSRSLGFSSYVKDGKVKCIICESEGIEKIPTVIERNQRPKNLLVTSIKDIEILPEQEHFGFELDGNGRYLHDDFTVTHNSSTVGVLISGKLDDGRGSARLKVLNFKHEVDTGRSSSISQQILGYEPDGKIVNHDTSIKKISWPEIAARSSKIIKFYDLCGHTKYSKTTIRGITANSVDYALITIGSNMGAKGNTREHIGVCLTMGIPIVILLTKIDLGEKVPNVMEETISQIKNIFSRPGSRKMLYNVNNMNDVVSVSRTIQTGDIVPMFRNSNTRGDGLNLLHEFLNMVRPRIQFDPKKSVEMHIDETFIPKGIGLVVGGFLKKGTLKVNEEYWLGPMNGTYKKVKCKSLHVNRTCVQEATPGRYVCVNIPKNERKSISRGMVLLGDGSQRKIVEEFRAEITVHRTHHTTIRVGYETMIHVNSLRATVRLIEIVNKKKIKLKKSREDIPKEESPYNVLSLGDRAVVKLRFCHKPCYINAGDRILLAESNIKMAGRVLDFA